VVYRFFDVVGDELDMLFGIELVPGKN